MDFKEQPIKCQTVLWTKLAEFYVYGRKRYVCGNCQKLEHGEKKVIRVPSLKDVQDHLQYLKIKIERMIDYLNTNAYMEDKESDETSMLEDLVQRMEDKHDKLKAAIEKAEQPYIYGEIDQRITSAMNRLQKDGIYIEFLIAQENKNVNILALKGQQQNELENDLEHKNQIKRFQDKIDHIKEEYNKKLEESLSAQKEKYKEKNQRLKDEKILLEVQLESINEQTDKQVEILKDKLKSEKQDYEKQLEKSVKLIALMEIQISALNSELEKSKVAYKEEAENLAIENAKIQSNMETLTANANLQKELLDQRHINDKKKMAFLESLIPIFKEIQNKAGDYLNVIIKILPYLDFSKNLTYEQLSYIFEGLTGEEIKADEDMKLDFSLNKKSHLHLLKVLNNFELPSVKHLRINNLPKDAEEVKDILLNIKLLSWERFHFNSNPSEIIDVTLYVKVIKNIAENINTKQICIYNWNIDTKKLVKLMSKLKHANAIGIGEWLLETDQEFSFKDALDGATFESLSFSNTGKKEFSNFKSHPERIENILKALGEVEDVRENLKYLGFNKENINTDEIENMLKNYKLNNCKLKIY